MKNNEGYPKDKKEEEEDDEVEEKTLPLDLIGFKHKYRSRKRVGGKWVYDYGDGQKKKSKKEKVVDSRTSVFKNYKFDGKIKYPDKITDKTLIMWAGFFGNKDFKSKSREENIKDFLLDIKQKKKGVLELLFKYSRDAIDDNLQKYSGITV